MKASPGQPVSDHTYDPSYFTRLFAVEDRHFWFRIRNQVISGLVTQLVDDLKPGYRVLEIGCGDGNVLRFLEQACPHGLVIGLDLFDQGLHYARRRVACSLVQGDLRNLPFGKKFNLIGLFDVLEHLDDDRRILRNLNCILAPTGWLLLTVPAHSSLWGYQDEIAYHRRRYELPVLEEKLKSAGYRVEYITPYMMSVFPLVWIVRRLQRLIGQRLLRGRKRSIASTELRVMPGVNDLLHFSSSWEVQTIADRRQLPIGTSLIAIARKEG